MLRLLSSLTLSFVMTSCSGPIGFNPLSKVDSNYFNSGEKEKGTYSVSDIRIHGGDIIVTGSGFDNATKLSVKIGSSEYLTDIVSKNSSQITGRLKNSLQHAAGLAFSLVIGNAYGDTIYTATYDILDGSITGIKLADNTIPITKLNGVLSGTGVSNGQTITWNGSSWVATTPSSSQVYVGTYNANTNSPNILSTTPNTGDYYIVSNAGTQNLGSGNVNYQVGDWVLYNGTSWDRIPSSNAVSSVFGRTGSITAQSGDYTWAQINKTTSSIGDIADVDITTVLPSTNDVLKFDGTKWVPGTISSTPGAGSITNSMLAGLIDQSKITNLTTDLASKEGTISAGTTTQYYRGDKTWQTLNKSAVGLSNVPNVDATDRANHTGTQTASTISDFANTVRSVILTGLSTATSTAVSATDSLLTAIGKLQAQNTVQDTSISGHSTSLATDASNIFQLQTDVSNLTTNVSSKEGTITAGTTSQYYRGDKTWQTLNTTAVAEGTNLYFTQARAIASPLSGLSATNSAILATDTILQGFNKTQGQINSLSSTVSTNSGDILSLQTSVSSLSTSIAGKEGTITAGTTSQYYRGDKTWQTLDKTAVGLSNVPNTDATSRSNHTGTQTASTISDFASTVLSTLATGLSTATNSAITATDSVLVALGKLQAQITANNHWTKTSNDIYYANKVTVGSSSIGPEQLSVVGNVKTSGQMYTTSFTDTTGNIDWANGNTSTTNFNCSTPINFSNLMDGGTYTFVNTNTGTTMCSFSTSVPVTGVGTQTVSYKFKPSNDTRDASSHTIYTLMRVGNVVYVNWSSGY